MANVDESKEYACPDCEGPTKIESGGDEDHPQAVKLKCADAECGFNDWVDVSDVEETTPE